MINKIQKPISLTTTRKLLLIVSLLSFTHCGIVIALRVLLGIKLTVDLHVPMWCFGIVAYGVYLVISLLESNWRLRRRLDRTAGARYMNCTFNARSEYLKCSVNPAGDCRTCRDFESVSNKTSQD
jgi:Family of unknown function (DUF6464)